MLKKVWREGKRPTVFQWECKLVKSLWKTVWRFLKKLKIELPYDPAVLLLDISVSKKTVIGKDKCTSVFIAANLQ